MTTTTNTKKVVTNNFDPKRLAFKALQMSKDEMEREKNDPEAIKEANGVAETQKFIWIIDGKVNMAIPVDGWNALHWYKYFSMHFRNVFDHMYTGKRRTDMLCLGSFLFRAQRELGMSASEVKACIDWIAKHKMPMVKSQGKIYFIAMLREDLNDFYNSKVYPMKHADERNHTKNRDIFIDPKDYRESIKKFLTYNEDGSVKDFDFRLLVQLGIPVMIEYLTVQECMDEKKACNFVLSKIEKIINEDISKAQIDKPKSLRFERMVKASLDWEPYPWKDHNWRELVKKGIEFFEIDKEKWWRPNPPIINLKPASCLKILKSKKREVA